MSTFENDPLFIGAYLRAIKILSYRNHSKKELFQKLYRKGYDKSLIELVITRLVESRYLNDEEYTKQYLEENYQKYSIDKLSYELTKRGIEKTTYEAILEEYRGTSDEESKCLALAQKRLELLSYLPEEKRNKRVYNYLLRRGFSPSIICKILFGSSGNI